MTEPANGVTCGELDGVPVFHADGPPPFTGGIAFRVGQADETFVGRGLTHLVEHLVLEPLVREHRTANGSVGMTITSFEATGEPGEVRDFINAAVRSLASLPYDRLDTEVRVLHTEGQRRGGSLAMVAHGMRFGPAGYGLVDHPELGLRRATPEIVDAWRRRWFTRDNAALWLSGPPPDGIDLSALPDGDRHAPPDAKPYPYRYPVWYPGADSHIAVSMLAPHDTALWTAHAVFQERLYERLRAREGRSYEVTVDYDRLSATDASLFVLTDTLPEEAERVRDAISVELHRLARSGATDDELDEIRRLRQRASRDPRFAAALAERYALDTLVAGAPELREDDDAELAALSGADVGAALREALDAALWLVPRDIGMEDQRVRPLPPGSEHAIEGREHTRPDGIPDDLAGDVLRVGDGGLSIVEDDGRLLTIERDACLAVQVFDDGARIVWGPDSISVFVHPAMWEQGEAAIDAIDALFHAGVRVDMGEASGYDPPVDEEPGSSSKRGRLLRWIGR